jgi:hypothetical protein
MRTSLAALALFVLSALTCYGQTVPEVIYYRFNEGAGTNTVNAASPGGGSTSGTLMGTMGFGPGQFGTGLTGTGAASATSFVATGYNMNLTGSSWTIEFWFTPNGTISLQYLCGVPVSGAFRVFCGAPGNNFVMSGTGLTTVILNASVPQVGTWAHVAFVYDATAVPPVITGYVNGAVSATVPQPGAPVLNTGSFIVGGQTGSGLDGTMDEFRLWLRARTAAEILSGSTVELMNENILAAQTTGGGVGDFTYSLTSISPSAAQGYSLLSADTTGPVATGPILGLFPDSLTWSSFSIPIGAGNPFHFPLGFPGVFPDQPLVVPPGTLSSLSGTTLDFVVLLLDPIGLYDGASNVVRVTF